MPPKFGFGGIKKVKDEVGSEKKIGPTLLFPTEPVLFPDIESFKLEEEKSRLQKFSADEKGVFISNAEDEEEKMPVFSITGVNFSILTKAILDKIAVVDVSTKISRTEDYFTGCDKDIISYRNRRTGCYKMAEPLPPENSITSYTEMGTTENFYLCPKCNKTNVDCPGHLGQISLNQHYIHPLFMEYAIWCLMSVCNSCSKILVSEPYMQQNGIGKLRGIARLKKISEDAKNARCENSATFRCVPNPEYDLKNIKDSYKVRYYLSKKDKDSPNIKEIEDIEKILDAITEKDAKLLGFTSGAHPRDMILKSFPVMPPCARPFTIREGQVKEDHLTTCYDEIINDNFKYARTSSEARAKGYESRKIEEGEEANCKRKYERDLHFRISHFIDNSDGKYCRSPTEKIKGIKQRIVKKEGLIRGNIMGKRVNFCGRSVAGPDSTLRFGEVALPESMSKILSVPEKVHSKNIHFIRDLWAKKKINYFFPGSGLLKNRALTMSEKLYDRYLPDIGDKVDRQLMDGDIVLVNRQPTLYKYSLIADKIKIVDRKTIGLHMVETKMRQADFDGDELNIHVAQALDARTEALTFANVEANIQSSLHTSSMIGIIYNSLSSIWIMTRPDPEVILTPEEMKIGHSYLTNKSYLSSLPARLKKHKVNPLSGRALFSSILPPTFYYKNDKVIIKDGVLVEGQISSAHVGKTKGTIQGSIWKWHGQQSASDFITDCTFITDWFISIWGLTFGYDDICPDFEFRKKVQTMIQNEIRGVHNNIDMLGPEKESMSSLEKIDREKKVYMYCSAAGTNIKSEGNKFLTPDNPLKIMLDSGAKGNETDISRITAMIGQISVSGGRPRKKYSQGKRCLPYFEMDTEDIISRGFGENSFLNGMSPSDMYFMSESAREGVANTSISTPDAGSMHHRLVKVMEDVKVDYDGSVRNARGTIYQFSYYDGYEVGELTFTKSKNTGDVMSFINLQEAANKINAEFQ